MLNNIVNNALNGMNIALGCLSVSSNNLVHANEETYHRQSAILGENPSSKMPNGYIGNGAYLSHIQREFDIFTNRQYNQSYSKTCECQVYMENSNQVDNFLSNNLGNIPDSINDFFTALDVVSHDASDKMLIESFLDKSNALINQFKEFDGKLQEIDNKINHQIASNIQNININIEKIASLNQEIIKLRTEMRSEPNDLLDIRDNLVHELSSLINVCIIEQDGNYNIALKNGLPLVTGGKINRLDIISSSEDSDRLSIAYIRENEYPHEISDTLLNGGELIGNLRSHREIIEPTSQKINKLALVLTQEFNQTYKKGFDITGSSGNSFFAIGKGYVVGHSDNNGSADFTVNYYDTSQISGNDYNLSFNGTEWSATRLPNSVSVSIDQTNTNFLKFEGIELKINNNAKIGDSFLVKSVSGVINGMKTLINDVAKFATAGSIKSGPSDNENVKALVKLQDQKLIKGISTLSDYYASIVNNIGNQTKEAHINLEVHSKMTENFYQKSQSISGVNINEESIYLQRIQQLFNANAQVLKTVDNLFNSLINIL